jgi:hypothetical protein
MRHVDEGALHAHLDGELATLGAARAAEVEHHLSACDDCRAALALARSERDRANAILRSAEPATEPIPGFDAVRARPPLPARDAVPRPRRRGVAIAWAASFAMALGVGWLARGGMRAHPAAEVAVLESRAEVAAAPARASDIERAEPPAASGADVEDAPAASAQPTLRRTTTALPPTVPENLPALPEPEIAVAAVSAEALARSIEQVDSASAAVHHDFVVRGTVTDEHGRALAGAQVTVPTLGRGVLSNEEGRYALSIPDTAVLDRDTLTVVVQLIGMERQSHLVPVAPGHAEAQDFRMTEGVLALESVVVTSGEIPRTRAERRAAPAAARVADAGALWRPTTAAGAAQWLGRAPLRIPELEVLRWERGAVEGARMVRMTQRLESGEAVVLVQLPSGASAAARAAAAPAASASLSRDGVEVLAESPLAADSLRALLERLR